MLAALLVATLLDFGSGPAQLLMTPEEQRAWTAVKTEEQARAFVDQFWAKRTAIRADFDRRVAYADANLVGSTTDRGRTHILAAVADVFLVADPFTLQPQNRKDPFAALQSKTKFKKSEELGWVVRYCGEGDPLAVAIRVTGANISFGSEAEEMPLEAIKAAPGCSLVRGAIPLSEFPAGAYKLLVAAGRYNLAREFTVD